MSGDAGLGLVRDVLAGNTSAPGLMLDANESWNRSQAVRHLHQLEQHFDLTWVEEPVRRWDVRGHASIRSHIASACSGVRKPRYGIFEAGMASSRDPKYVVVQPALITDPTAVRGTPQPSWKSGGVVVLRLSR